MNTYSSIALAGLIPIQLMVPNTIGDLAMSGALITHMAVSNQMVIDDYVPAHIRDAVSYAVYAITGVAGLGLIKLSVSEPGLTATVKQLWKKPLSKE